VPSCSGCNPGAGRDDEYFRRMLAFRDTVGDHPVVREHIIPTELRSLQRPQARYFTRAFLEDSRRVRVCSRAGLDLNWEEAYDVNLVRISQVAARVVSGLYVYERGHRVPDGYVVRALGIDSLQWDHETWDSYATVALAPMAANGVRSRGGTVFQYWVSFAGESPVSSWLLRFYDAVSFIGFVLPSARLGGPATWPGLGDRTQ